MVVATKWREGVFSVVFLAPPFVSTGGTWAEAAITYRTTSSFERKTLPRYDYPFPPDKRIVQEAMKASGNIEMLQEIVTHMNKGFHNGKGQSIDELEVQSFCPEWKGLEGKHIEGNEIINWKNESERGEDKKEALVKASASSADMLSEEFINRLVLKLSKKLSIPQEANLVQEEADSSSSSSHKNSSIKKHKKKKKTSSSSSSSSSSSWESSRSSSSTSDVGLSNKKVETGWFEFPFSHLDTRHVSEPKNTMKGRHEERKMLRKALHNLYSEYTTMKWYVDSLKAEQSNTMSKPLAADLNWLSHHANYLDQILLHSAKGPWKAWNELSLDHIARAFLELLVRASPTRTYPEILDEKVRRWMKKKRVGMSTQYGPIPPFLVDAKITDSRVQPKGGWLPFGKKDNKFPPFQNT